MATAHSTARADEIPHNALRDFRRYNFWRRVARCIGASMSKVVVFWAFMLPYALLCWHVWPRINFVTKMVAGIFIVIMWAAIDTGAWNRNARDVRRETDAMQRQALLDAKMTVGSWASRYLGTPRWGASFRYKNS